MKKIPKSLKGVLWSADVSKLDLEEDKAYIIHQILSLGTIEEVDWLFSTYSSEKVKTVFLKQPMKIYDSLKLRAALSLLGASPDTISVYRYDQTLQRRLE